MVNAGVQEIKGRKNKESRNFLQNGRMVNKVLEKEGMPLLFDKEIDEEEGGQFEDNNP